MELVTGIEPVTLSLPRIRSADWATPAYVMNGCGDRTWTCDLRVMSPTSYQLLHPAMNGGGRRIRTFEVEDGRFTVCSLWPLGNPSKNNGAGDRNWTHNLLITSQLLYRLSYASIPQHGILYIFLNNLSIEFLAQIDFLFNAYVSRIALYYNSIGNIFTQVFFYKNIYIFLTITLHPIQHILGNYHFLNQNSLYIYPLNRFPTLTTLIFLPQIMISLIDFLLCEEYTTHRNYSMWGYTNGWKISG